MNYLKWGIGIFVIGIAIVIWGAVTQWKFIPNKNSGSSPGPSPGSPKPVKNVIWHVNSKMGSVNKFPWDPNYKMKGMIENFIVGIWPVGGAAGPNTGDIIDEDSLIKIAKDYATKVGANVHFYLLPNQVGFKPLKTPADIVWGIDAQMHVLQTHGVKCEGVLLEDEELYGSGGTIVKANQITAALRSQWVNTMKKLKVISGTNTKIARYTGGDVLKTIKTYDSPTSPLSTPSGPLAPNCDFIWPDSYEPGWVGAFGHWKTSPLQHCPNPPGPKDYLGCPVLPGIQKKYNYFLETSSKPCCAGTAYLSPSNSRYCVDGKDWGPINNDLLNINTFIKDPANGSIIFAAGGPGADLGIRYSSPDNCSSANGALFDVVAGFNKAYGQNWGLIPGNSIALYG